MKMKVFVVFVILTHVFQHALSVLVFEGMESVRLPCQVSGLPKNTKVVWSRFDLNPSTVHQHQYEPYVQNQQYSNRTSVSSDALKTGDLSLTLKTPHHSDSGIYTCTVHNDKKENIGMSVRLHVIGSRQASNVTVLEGEESVRLTCHVSGLPENTKVVWKRLDINPTIVHQHQDKNEPYVQNQQYSSRTLMSADALKTGHLSLYLKNPHHSDSGIYTCTVYNNKNEISRRFVQLNVRELPTFPAGAYTVLAAVLAALASGLAVHFWYTFITVSKVEVEEGVWLVKLPCKTKVQLPRNVIVEWSRCAPNPMIIHNYQNGSDLLVRQDKFYCDRTKMEKEPLKTGDLSLTLREPWSRDSGIYICTVYCAAKVWMQKVVRLNVKHVIKVVEVRECAKSVTLPFRTCVKLPEDATVEWCMNTGTLVAVHLNQSGKKKNSYRGQLNKNLLQTGDLSLTLIKPTQADSSMYFCTVCGYGDVLFQRIVFLNVQGRGF